LQTTIADNVGLVERAWVDSINKRSKEKFLELHGENAVLYDPTLGSLKGRPALDQMWTGLFSMFPDCQIRSERYEVLAKMIGYVWKWRRPEL
jgi:ketosteroid isomerase-like protein